MEDEDGRNLLWSISFGTTKGGANFLLYRLDDPFVWCEGPSVIMIVQQCNVRSVVVDGTRHVGCQPDVLRLPSATRSSFILANPTWPDSCGSVATYVEILHSVIQERRGGLGEAVSGRKGLGRSMSGGPVVSIGRWEGIAE